MKTSLQAPLQALGTSPPLQFSSGGKSEVAPAERSAGLSPSAAAARRSRGRARHLGSPSICRNSARTAALSAALLGSLPQEPRLEHPPGRSESKRKSRLGRAQIGHPPGNRPAPAPCPQAKPRRPLPPSRWGVLAARGSAAPGLTHPPEFGAKDSGRRARRAEKKETFRAGGERARVPSAGLRNPSPPLPRPGPAASVANRLGPPRRRHCGDSQSRGPRRRIGCGALFLEVPVYSRWGCQSPWLLVSQPLCN